MQVANHLMVPILPTIAPTTVMVGSSNSNNSRSKAMMIQINYPNILHQHALGMAPHPHNDNSLPQIRLLEQDPEIRVALLLMAN